MRIYCFSFLFLGFASAMLCAQSEAVVAPSPNAPLRVNIDNPNFRRLVVTIPDFEVVHPSKIPLSEAKSAAAYLRRLLTFSGFFNIMASPEVKPEPAKNSGGKDGLDGIDIAKWKALGVESVTKGELGTQGGEWELTLRTVDIVRGELLLGKKYSKFKPSEIETVLRRYGDLILDAYTGRGGIFASKLTFIGRKTKSLSKQVYVCDFDGSNLKQISTENVPHLSPRWSRNGNFITFTSYRDGNPDLYLYRMATGELEKISAQRGLNSGSNWGPNDALIAMTGSIEGDANIYVLEPFKKTPRRMLIKGDGLDVDPAFSPDGKYLAFVSGRYGNPHIFRATLEWSGATGVRVTEDKRLTYAGWYNATPSWSPDSQKLAFAGYDKDINRFDLFLMNPDGTQLERLTLRSGDNESPSWSPNGQMIAFHSSRLGTIDRKGSAKIWVMNRDGGSQRDLGLDLYDAQTPHWSTQRQ